MFQVWGPLRAQGRGKLFNTGLLLQTFEEGTVRFVSGGPYGPKGGGTVIKLTPVEITAVETSTVEIFYRRNRKPFEILLLKIVPSD